MLLVHIE